VSVALLRELGSRLVEIHGQHDDRGLLNPRGHRDLLDTFGGGLMAGGIAAAGLTYAAWRSSCKGC
jgi:DNA repair protein RecN (Recombination protein N)